MNRFRVFVSSVQSEFAAERQALKEYFREDPLLQRFFRLFLFEDIPASDRRLDDVYLRKVDNSDVYVGLLGWGYGNENEDGLSPTEKEYDRASERGIHRLVFVKGKEDGARHPKTQALIGKAQVALVRRRFDTTAELKTAIYASLVEFLESRSVVRRGQFDPAPSEGTKPGAKLGPSGGQAHGEGDQAGGQAGPSGGQATNPPLSSRDLDILRAAEAGPASRKKLLVAGRYSGRSGSFRRRLAHLVAGGLLKMTLPNKPTSPSQRYRLTREGRAALVSAEQRQNASLHTGE